MSAYELLVAVGVSLIVIGVALRGAAAGVKRRLVSERQHQRLSGEPTGAARPLTHWERHVGNYARAAIALGVTLTVTGFVLR